MIAAAVTQPRIVAQRGMALVVTLIMVVVMLLVMASITYQQQLDFKRSSQALLADQVLLLALSGESWSRKILRDDARENQIDSHKDGWAQVIPVLPVEGGNLTGCLIDLQSRYNLNNLGAYTQASFESDLSSPAASQVGVYLNLLALLERESGDERAAVIVDWIDTDTAPVASGGAEDQDYSIETPARLAANHALVDLSELVAIRGYSAADLAAMRPYVTALRSPTDININTASRTVLRALMAGFDAYLVDAVIENRPYDTVNDFYNFAAAETGYMTVGELTQQVPPSLIGVSSKFFELNARVELAGTRMGLRSVLYRPESGEVRTLTRTFEYIPRLEIEDGQSDPVASPCHQPVQLRPPDGQPDASSLLVGRADQKSPASERL